MKNAFLVGLYIIVFQITPYVNDFQTLNQCFFIITGRIAAKR